MNKKKSALSRALGYIGRYKILLPVSIILSLISVAATLLAPIIIGAAIDRMIGAGAVIFEEIIPLLISVGVIVGVSAVAQWLMSTINNRIAFNVTRDIRNEAFSKIERLPLSYIDTHPHGDVTNRIINDTDRFSEGLLLGFTQVFVGALTIVGTLIAMLIIRWEIALVVVLLTPLSIFIAKFIGTRTYNMFHERSLDEASATALIDEVVGGARLVRAFGKGRDMNERFSEASGRLQRSTLKAIFFSSLTNPTTRFVNNMVYAAVALVGAIYAIATKDLGSAAFTIGAFTTLLSYTNQYTKPFNEISGIFAEFQGALASAARVFDLIEEVEEPSDKELPELSGVTGEVELSDVSFSYTEDKPLIEGLTLKVKPGERVAIVGPTGCGKTTLINLLMRFYDARSGVISLDGRDTSAVKRKSLRTSFGMVLQDTWLSGTTVKENIRYGKPDATDGEVIAAAKAAHAHSFIKRLPRGYDTVVTDGLSEGQRQLISIARVMLLSPPMLILDEATSSIDTRTEIKIQRAFHELMRGRTSFIVAHRLSTVKEADVILVMHDGKIVETGTHRDLIAMGGFYSTLYNSQFAK